MTRAILYPGEYVIPPAIQRFAEAFLALANTDDQGAQVSAATARKAMEALSAKYQNQIAAYWDEANKKALRLLILVMENNPQKSRNEILKRPDIRAILRQPYEQAAARSEALLRKAWDQGEQTAVKHTKAELKTLKADWEGHELDLTLRDALIADLHANAKAMRSRYRDALRDRETAAHRLQVVSEDATRRARYSVQAAIWGVATQVRDTAAAAAGLNKIWIAVLDDQTCSHCKALHATVIGPGDQFPADAGATPLGVYQGALLGPPRHPNCRCVLVLTRLQKSKKQN